MVYVAFIVYGCLIPFQYSGWEQVAANLGDVSWIPFVDSDGSRASIPDVVQNVLFFMPFGFLGFLCLKTEWRSRVVRLSVLALLLSASVEALQLFTSDRTTSPTDVVTNVLGAVVGVASACVVATAAAWLPDRWRNDWLHRETFFLLSVATITVVLSMSQPFDFALDVGMLSSRIKLLVREPVSLSDTLRDEGVLWLQFMLLGYSAQLFFGDVRRKRAVMLALAFSVLLAVALEAMQLIITSRLPALRDMLVVSAGALVGVFACRVLHVKLTKRVGVGLVLVATAIAAAIAALSPFQFRSAMSGFMISGFNWIPFLAYYERTSFVALSNFIESMLIYFPLAFVAQYVFKTKGVATKVVAFVVGCAMVLEVLQGFVEGRYPDVTDVLGALAGAVVGCWIAQSRRELAMDGIATSDSN